MAKRPVLDISGANGGNLLIEKHQVEIVDADSKNPTPVSRPTVSARFLSPPNRLPIRSVQPIAKSSRGCPPPR